MDLLIIAVVGLFLSYFQVVWAPEISVLGVIPNFLIGYVIYFSTKLSFNKAITAVLILGLAIEIVSPILLGLNTFAMLILCFLVNTYHETLNKERFFNVILCIIGLNLVYFFVYLLYILLVSGGAVSLFIRIPWSIVYNSGIAIVIVFILTFISKLRIIFYD